MSITVTIILDKKRESKKGFPVKIRVSNNRIQNFISLKLYLSEDEFRYIKAGKRLNEEQKHFQHKFIKAEFKANNILREMDEYSFQSYRELYDGKKPKEINTNIDSLFNTYIEELKEDKKFGSAAIYTNTNAVLNKFKRGVKIERVDSKFLRAFHKYLLAGTYSGSLIFNWIYFKDIRAFDILSKYKNNTRTTEIVFAVISFICFIFSCLLFIIKVG